MPIAIGFELVANRFHLRNDAQVARAGIGHVVKSRATNPHQPASFCDGDAAGPAMTDVFTFLGRGAFFRAPFRNSISSAWRPTMRSNAAILASYSWSRSAAWAGVFVQGARCILLNPDANQLTRDIMPLGKRVQALHGNELLGGLPLELNAVGTLWGHGFHPLKAQLTLSNH